MISSKLWLFDTQDSRNFLIAKLFTNPKCQILKKKSNFFKHVSTRHGSHIAIDTVIIHYKYSLSIVIISFSEFS